VPDLRDVADIIKYHHENYDGSGCTLGLVAEQIPLTSRIIRVASKYDLLTQPRDTTRALNHQEAVDELSKGAGKEYDARVVRVLSEIGLQDLSGASALNAVRISPELITCAVN